jgi:hypothetical protein
MGKVMACRGGMGNGCIGDLQRPQVAGYGRSLTS